METQKTDHKLVKLEPVDMHGPVEVSIKVHMYLPDELAGGKTGSLTYTYLPGVLPTRADLADMVGVVMDADRRAASDLPPGVRPMTKPEFVAYITRRETGESFPVPGDQHFVPVPPDVPHGMLVHAIAGVGVPEQLADEYKARGLVERDGVGDYWNNDKLADLPGDVLLAIYERLTQ